MIEARLLFQTQQANGFEDAQSAHTIDIGRVLRRLEADRDVGLRAEVVHLIRLNFLDDAGQVRRVGQVAVVQHEVLVFNVTVLIDVVDPLRIERRRTAFDAVYFVALFQQKLSEIGTVLASNSGDQRAFLFHFRVPVGSR